MLEQRIKDGLLSDAPIFCGDIREWIANGYAAAYTGLVDCIAGGFPCQPFSNAGKQSSIDDRRNMWPATIECIRIIRPNYALLENVPGLIATGYLDTVIGDLTESGYDARWRLLSAAELGAPHKRDRLWIAAYTDRDQRSIHQRDGETPVFVRQDTLGGAWWLSEPSVSRVDDGATNRVGIDSAIGNAQVPIVAATAWKLLTEGLL